MVIFYTILNIAGINAQVIFSANNPQINMLRRNFLREMANGLIYPHLQRRAGMANLPRNLKLRLQEVTGIRQEDAQENIRPGRCAYCNWRQNRKTRFSCFMRNRYMCLEHITGICQLCKESVSENK